MSCSLLRTLVPVGLWLCATACGDAPRPDVDLQAVVESPVSAEVIDVAAEGVPTFVRGHLGQRVPGAVGLLAALPGVAKLFRIDPSQLVLTRVSRDAAGNTFVRYAQRKNGLPVVNAELLLHVSPVGEIFAANGSARDGTSLSAEPTLTEEQARAIARADASRTGSTVRDPSRLVYVRSSLDQELYLAYELRVSGGARAGVPVDDLLFVGARDGALVDRHPLVHTALQREVHTASSDTVLPGPSVRTEGQAATGDTIVDINYDRLRDAYACYSTNFGRDSFDNAGATIISSVHYGSGYANAYWNGTQVVYGDGDGSTSAELGTDADVTVHELTHAVTAKSSNLTYSGQSGGLNEGLSDIFAAYCQSAASGTWSTADEVFKIAEAVWTPGTANDALRYMDDPKKDGVSLDYASDVVSGTDVHYSSGVPNLAFALLVRGGTHPRGRSSVQVTGIGMEKAGRIFYEANVNCLTAGATFLAAKTCTENKATALYGATVAASVTQAWEAVGVVTPPAGCTPVALTNGVAITGVSASKDGQKCFSLNVPAGASNLAFATSGGSGDVDLYVRFGAAPTTSTYDCRPYAPGNAERCTFSSVRTGTYYVMLNGFADFAGVSLVGSYSTGGGGTGSTLSNGVETAPYEGATNSWKCSTFSVPSGKSALTFTQAPKSGATGDADLFVKLGAQPTQSSYDCRPNQSGSSETCTLSNPAAGTWYACSYGYSAYSNVTMKGAY